MGFMKGEAWAGMGNDDAPTWEKEKAKFVTPSLSHAGASSLVIPIHASPYINTMFPVLAFYSSWTS
jgi:hypothetical protein